MGWAVVVVAAGAAGRQQPSLPAQAVIAVCEQATLQLAALPVIVSVVQTSPSLQLCGQLPTGSQVSPLSRTPLPQVREQSVSLFASQAEGQQPSPETQLTMSVVQPLPPQGVGLTSTKQSNEASVSRVPIPP